MWRCPNPGHVQTGRTPPLSVFRGHRGEQRWHCHGCGEGGTAIDLLLACRGGNLREALNHLAGRVGHHHHGVDWEPLRRTARPTAKGAAGCRDPVGLQHYVDECAERLWQPEGRAIRRWLTDVRGLAADVLAENRIGADLGPRRQPRPDGMPRALGAVLPVISRGAAVYAQIRVPHPGPDRPRYLNPTTDLAANPRLARIQPAECSQPEIIVTEGGVDALSAAAGGYRAVAVLSAGYSDEAASVALARLPHPLVIAFDADDAGQAAAHRLVALLKARQRPPVVLDLGSGDLNDALLRSDDWPTSLSAKVQRAIHSRPGLAIER